MCDLDGDVLGATNSELALVVEHFHATSNASNFMNDRFAAASFDNVDQ